MGINADNFEMILLPGKNPPEKYLNYYNLAYQCWRETWQQAYKQEMNHFAFLASDNFTRQDEILALYYEGKCVGMTFFRSVNFAEVGTLHDSYFEHWPELTIRKLCQRGKNVLIVSQFTVDLNYRKDFHGISLRDLLIGLCYERFLYAHYDGAVTAVRIQKQMEQAVFKVGATLLFKNAPYIHNQMVDLVAFYPDTIHESTVPGIKELVAQIFPKVISLVHPIKHKKEVKRVA